VGCLPDLGVPPTRANASDVISSRPRGGTRPRETPPGRSQGKRWWIGRWRNTPPRDGRCRAAGPSSRGGCAREPSPSAACDGRDVDTSCRAQPRRARAWPCTPAAHHGTEPRRRPIHPHFFQQATGKRWRRCRRSKRSASGPWRGEAAAGVFPLQAVEVEELDHFDHLATPLARRDSR